MLLSMKDVYPIINDSFSPVDIMAYGPKRWRRVQHLSDQFWSQWRRDYLQTLQYRCKLKATRSLTPGDVVLLRDPGSKRYQWPIARVVSVNKNSDGLVRSATISTSCHNSSGTRQLCRPVTELSLLVPAE